MSELASLEAGTVVVGWQGLSSKEAFLFGSPYPDRLSVMPAMATSGGEITQFGASCGWASIHDTFIFSFSGRLRPEARDAMNIELDLTRHCIETELKRRSNAAISRYFKAGDGKNDMEEELALLEQAIRAFDFQSLRSRWPAFSGGAGIRVVLVRDDAGKPMLSLDNRFIIPPANLL